MRCRLFVRRQTEPTTPTWENMITWERAKISKGRGLLRRLRSAHGSLQAGGQGKKGVLSLYVPQLRRYVGAERMRLQIPAGGYSVGHPFPADRQGD